MAANPTIIVASLDDKEMKQSIANLVAQVKRATHTMATDFDSAVNNMNASLKKLGNMGNGSTSAQQTKSDTEAMKQNTAARKENAQAAKEQKATFDQLAEATKAASRIPSEMRMETPKSARDSFYVFQSTFTQRAKELAEGIRKAEEAFNSALDRKLQVKQMEWQQKLDATRQKLEAFRSNMGDSPTVQQMREEQRLNNLMLQQQAMLNKIRGQRWQMIEPLMTLQKEQTKVLFTMHDMAREEQQDVLTAKQRAIEEQKRTEEIRKQANAIRQMQDWKGRGGVMIDNYYLANLESELTPKRKRKTLEEQILKLQQEGVYLQKNATTGQYQAVDAEGKLLSATRTENQELKRRNDLIREQAAAARNAMNQYGTTVWRMPNTILEGKEAALVYAENDARARGLTIEQQIEQILKEEAQIYENATNSAKQRAETEKQVTEEVLRRKKVYEKPDTKGNELFGKMLSSKIDSNVNLNAQSLKGTTTAIKQLEDAYSRLSNTERRSPFGKQLREELQRLRQQAHSLKSELSRPVNLDNILAIKPKTLDDIAYKMQQLQSYKQGIDLTKPGAAEEIQKVDHNIQQLQKDADKWMGKQKNMIEGNAALLRSWNYMKNRLAFYFTVGASTQFIKQLIEVRSQYEMNERALGILIDSAERGTQIFNELSQMALVSPYTLIELSTAAKQLTAYDIAAKDVVDTTRRLADMTAAVGIPIERLTYALGQIKAYGYLNSRDARMFSNAGIPLVKQLSEYYTELEGRLVSTADVYDRIKKKSVDFEEVVQVIYHMTDEGGKFFNFQAKMADTLKVRLANLTLAWNNMLNEIGKSQQGVITWGIGALKQLFLHWKDLDGAFHNVVWAVGLRTAFMLVAYAALKTAGAMGANVKQMQLSAVFGKRLAGVLKTVAASFKAILTNPLTWWSLLIMAAIEATSALLGVNEAQKSLNESIRKGAEDNSSNIKKFLEQYKSVQESLYKTEKSPTGGKDVVIPVDIGKNDAKKAWEAIREQIELTSSTADVYIQRLLSIENMSERVRQGFSVLNDIEIVNAALKEIDNNTIKVSGDLSSWWNLWMLPDGLIENLEDFADELNSINEEYGTFDALLKENHTHHNEIRYNEYTAALKRFRDDLKETTDSIIEFIELKGWKGDTGKINQVFEQITQKLTLENQLDPQKAFILQTEVEAARSEAAKQALQIRIADEQAALKVARDEESKATIEESLASHKKELANWDDYNGRKRVEWNRFTKWLKEQHISETTAMFRNMDAEDIKSLDFQKGNHAKWVTDMVTKYAKEHKMSYDEAFKYLKAWVRDANQWSVFIPLIISTEDKKSVFDTLEELDKQVDDADKKIERLTKRRDQLKRKTKLEKKELQELVRVNQELSDAQKEKDEAEAQGGHGKKEDKDAKKADAAAKKAQKEAESALQKALKEEMQLIDKVRSSYKTLTKEGVSSQDALKLSTEGFEKSVEEINDVLGKYGIGKIDLKNFAGIENPRELVEMLQAQMNGLLKSSLTKAGELQDLEIKIRDLKLDASSFDYKKLTDSLNNELGKLKDEYELALELEANPELGDMFSSMFNIDKNELASTFGEALSAAQKEVDKQLSSKGLIFNILEEDIEKFAESNKLARDSDLVKALENIQKTWREMFNKNITETEKALDDFVKKYGDYSDKIAEIEADRLEKLRKLNEAYFTDEMKKRPEYIAKLTAINAGATRQKQSAEFEDFKNSRYYTMMFENLDYISTQTIRDMRDKIRELMDTMGELKPEQLKTLISQYEKLEEKLVKRSPFKTLAKDVKTYFKQIKDRRAANDAFKNAQKEYDAEKKVLAALKEKQEQAKRQKGISQEELDCIANEVGLQQEIVDKLKEQLELAEKKADKYNLVAKLAKSEALQVANVIATNLKSLAELRDQFNQLFGVDASKGETLIGHNLDAVIDDLSAAADGISKVVSAAQSGDVIGVVSGAVSVVTGIGDAVASVFGDGAARTKKINKEINKSVETVRQLNMAYKELEQTVSKTMGDTETLAKRQQIANKEAQLAELERRQALEQSKRGKDRDEDAIKQNQESIQDLRLEIQELKDDVVSNLLGSDVKSAAEEFVDTWVEAWKAGETTLDAVKDKMDEVIINLIKKAMASKIVGTLLEPFYKMVDDATLEASEGGAALTTNELLEISNKAGVLAGDINTALGAFFANLESLGIASAAENSDLSALQQGIQAITEDTAGALEAYMNGMSQQVYLHSDLLTQIRDAVVELNTDLQLGAMTQILIQLQASYQVQMSIQTTINGWSNPSGQAVRVELIA